MNKIKNKQADIYDYHDHSACIENAISKAEIVCKNKGLRFTKIRRKVLQLICSGHKPLGAYDILDCLREEGIKAEPPTVYRALGFLIEAELVHRLDTLNAFIGCVNPETSHQGQFLICRDCKRVSEMNDNEIIELINSKAINNGFSATQQILEIEGQCNQCK